MSDFNLLIDGKMVPGDLQMTRRGKTQTFRRTPRVR
jgi:hypothetical protein